MKERPDIRSPRPSAYIRPHKYLLIVAEADDDTISQIVELLRQQNEPPEPLKQ